MSTPTLEKEEQVTGPHTDGPDPLDPAPTTRPHGFRAWFKRHWAAMLVVLIALAGTMVVAAIPGAKKESPPSVIPAVNVAVMPIEPIPLLKDTTELPASVEPWVTVELRSEIAGEVVDITAHKGELVKPNQPLVYLRSDLLSAVKEQAEAQLDLDQREVLRLEDGARSGVVSEKELDRARATVKISQARLDEAQARLNRAVISAPARVHEAIGEPEFIGWLDRLPIELGGNVQPGQLLAVLVDMRHVRVVVDLPERYRQYIRAGAEATVRIEPIDGSKGLARTGEIVFVAETAETGSRTFHTEIRLENAEGLFKGGMIVTVALVRREIPNAVMIPFDAAIPVEDGYQLYVSEGGFARARLVRLGMLKGSEARVLDEPTERPGRGLRTGDRLILDPRLISDGQSIVERPDPTSATNQPATAPDRQTDDAQ